jgi:hypothetical protein
MILLSVAYFCLFLLIYCCGYLHRLLRYGYKPWQMLIMSLKSSNIWFEQSIALSGWYLLFFVTFHHWRRNSFLILDWCWVTITIGNSNNIYALWAYKHELHRGYNQRTTLVSALFGPFYSCFGAFDITLCIQYTYIVGKYIISRRCETD